MILWSGYCSQIDLSVLQLLTGYHNLRTISKEILTRTPKKSVKTPQNVKRAFENNFENLRIGEQF